MTFSEALEHVSSPSSHSTDGNDASKITEPICTGTNQMTEPTCTKSNQMTEPNINSGTLYKTAEPTCTETNQTNEPSCTETNQMTNSGTSPNSVSANNYDLGEKKLDKPKIHVNAGTTENVNGIKNFKKRWNQIARIEMGNKARVTLVQRMTAYPLMCVISCLLVENRITFIIVHYKYIV